MTIEISIIFKIVPNPGFCFNGYHNNKTKMLTMNVVTPIDKFDWNEIPWASTVQGLTPWFAVIKRVSPIANKINPKTRYKIVLNLGLKFRGSCELHDKFGIFLIFKILSKKFIDKSKR